MITYSILGDFLFAASSFAIDFAPRTGTGVAADDPFCAESIYVFGTCLLGGGGLGGGGCGSRSRLGGSCWSFGLRAQPIDTVGVSGRTRRTRNTLFAIPDIGRIVVRNVEVSLGIVSASQGKVPA